MPCRGIRAHYEQLTEFERGRIIELKEAEWVENGRFQRHDGSGRIRVRSAVTASDSSLSTIRRTTRTRVSTMTIHRRLIEQNLLSYRPLRHLPFTPALCRARLQ
ncbi:HTH_Tnp_Tc3_2 domain-containing protein [Trichonephila clavipes]|uniref:HTH_Tnp_Tc3_2 domain-containing protein n=1 Tax=Trichonephila clavipes TaxID=2585209 RepID=A0A8X6S7C5_TRICX|nr:HTH_Tnp_Tc3_2 domain-containing protein [Trichonephila clavipes]